MKKMFKNENKKSRKCPDSHRFGCIHLVPERCTCKRDSTGFGRHTGDSPCRSTPGPSSTSATATSSGPASPKAVSSPTSGPDSSAAGRAVSAGRGVRGGEAGSSGGAAGSVGAFMGGRDSQGSGVWRGSGWASSSGAVGGVGRETNRPRGRLATKIPVAAQYRAPPAHSIWKCIGLSHGRVGLHKCCKKQNQAINLPNKPPWATK